MFRRLFNHEPMIADRVRMEAYRKAIQETVRKGDVVADIGTGSGILAFFSLQAGASKVYAIEHGRIIKEAERLAKINGLAERIVFVAGRSDRVHLRERVDGITSEILGLFGLEEYAVEFMIDARRRFLKPEGRLIPSWLELHLVPVASEEIWNDLTGVWSRDYYGFDLSAIRSYATSRRLAIDCSGKVTPLAAPSMITRVDFYEIEKMPLLFQGRFLIEKKGPLHGLVGYFHAGLSPSVVLSTSLEDPRTHWMQTFFPIEHVVFVEEGDEVAFKMRAIPLKHTMFWEWGTTVYRNGDKIAAFEQSDLHISKEELVVGKTHFRPVLTEQGEVCRRVLQLCDGKRSMGEISEIIRAEYPETYGNFEEAFQKVIAIVRRNISVD